MKLNIEEIDGCVAGSATLHRYSKPTTWEAGDIDIFVYSWKEFNRLSQKYYDELDTFEQMKVDMADRGKLATFRIEDYNIVYKPKTTNIYEVLAAFDFTAVMIGVECKDWSLTDPEFVVFDKEAIEKKSLKAVYKFDRSIFSLFKINSTTDRVIKYAARGFECSQAIHYLIDIYNQKLEFAKAIKDSTKSLELLQLNCVICHEKIELLADLL